jgi:hypothetical protein
MKRSSKEYWMKRKRYGWGLTPSAWQGWLVILLQVAIVVTGITLLPASSGSTVSRLIKFWIIFGLAIATIILVSVYSGPSPRWRWGKKDTDDSRKDS